MNPQSSHGRVAANTRSVGARNGVDRRCDGPRLYVWALDGPPAGRVFPGTSRGRISGTGGQKPTGSPERPTQVGPGNPVAGRAVGHPFAQPGDRRSPAVGRPGPGGPSRASGRPEADRSGLVAAAGPAAPRRRGLEATDRTTSSGPGPIRGLPHPRSFAGRRVDRPFGDASGALSIRPHAAAGRDALA
jgi:hypothetical protein